MKKLIIIFGLSVISPMCAMELAIISKRDISSFSCHLSMAAGYSKKMVEEKQIPVTNPIYVMLSQLNDELGKHSKNIVQMVESDQDLNRRINEFSSVDFNPLVQFGMNQIKQRAADISAAQAYVMRTRQILAGLEFLKTQPGYSNAWINEVGRQDRIGFMERNANYPLDENSVKNYQALFIYQTLIAPIIAPIID